MQRSILFSSLLSVTLIACAQQEPDIDFGKAECAHCRMNVVDRQFGSVIITNTGKQFAFDDVQCMVEYVQENSIAEAENAGWYVCDYAHPARLIDATTAYYARGDAYRSPMRGDIAAFGDPAERDSTMQVQGGDAIDWERVRGSDN